MVFHMLDWLRKALERKPEISEHERPVLAVVVEQLRELKHRQDSIEFAWTETLDKLIAREDRERKRLAKALKTAVEPSDPPEATPTPTDDRNARLRQIRARVIQNHRGG